MSIRTRTAALLARIAPVAALASMLAVAAPAAHADDGYLVFNTFAFHLQESEGRNTVTPGIGWEYSPSGRLGFHGGTLSDSFGYQAFYGGLNYATPRLAALDHRVRFILGATVLHKQFLINGEPDTKIVPLPAMELTLGKRAVLNISGSPEIDYGEHHNNAVVFMQFKLGIL